MNAPKASASGNAEHDRQHQAAGRAGEHVKAVGADHVETVRQVDDPHAMPNTSVSPLATRKGANRTAASSASGSGSLFNPYSTLAGTRLP